MPTTYTSLLGLALPATGELSGTWGDTVNNYITSYIDAAVEGTQTISGTQTAVTLSTANGTSLSQVGTNPTGSAQYSVINCTGSPSGLLTITAPASSRQYIVINATSTSQSVKVVGVGPTTGVTIVSGEKAIIAWDGSDFVKVATSTGTGNVTASGNNAFTGANTFYNATGQTFAQATANDGIVIQGRAGGSASYRSTFTTATLSASRTVTFPDATTTVAGTDATQTLTNKRIDPRVTSTTSASSLTPDISAADMYAYTALAANLTINAPTGTPLDGDKLIFRILDNGVSRTLTWNATFTAIGVTIPTATTANKMTYVGCIYNAANTRWDVIAVSTQA